MKPLSPLAPVEAMCIDAVRFGLTLSVRIDVQGRYEAAVQVISAGAQAAGFRPEIDRENGITRLNLRRHPHSYTIAATDIQGLMARYLGDAP